MNCPKCESRMYVMEQKTDGKRTYRRYKCRCCNTYIYTEEKANKNASQNITKIHRKYNRK